MRLVSLGIELPIVVIVGSTVAGGLKKGDDVIDVAVTFGCSPHGEDSSDRSNEAMLVRAS